jgi:type IV pilus assembly protein PilE
MGNTMKSRSLHLRVYECRHQSGFTLVELMITVAIMAILTAIVVPAYTSYVVKANRGAAKACMSEYAQFMERYYTTAGNLSYAGATPGTLGCASDANLNSAYTFSVTTNINSPRLYTVTAAPAGAQLSRDTQCGTLTLDQAGMRSKSGSAALNSCW